MSSMPEPPRPESPPESAPASRPQKADEVSMAEMPGFLWGKVKAGARLLWQLGPAGILGIAWTAMPAIMGFTLLYHLDTLSTWLREHREMGFVGYVCVFIVSAGLGLLPTYAQSILGGWVFGAAWGIPGALVGFTGGAMVGYYTARLVSRDRVEKVIESRPTWGAVRDALVGGSFMKTVGMVALVRLPPNSPFAITNLLLSTSGVKIAPYALGTAIGMLPRTALAAGLAAAAASTGAEGIGDFVRESKKNKYLLIGGLVAMFVVLGIIGHIANKAIAKVTKVRPKRCPKCLYDVQGSVGNACPECGEVLVKG